MKVLISSMCLALITTIGLSFCSDGCRDVYNLNAKLNLPVAIPGTQILVQYPKLNNIDKKYAIKRMNGEVFSDIVLRDSLGNAAKATQTAGPNDDHDASSRELSFQAIIFSIKKSSLGEESYEYIGKINREVTEVPNSCSCGQETFSI